MKNKILILGIVILLAACAAEAQPVQSTPTKTQLPTATASPTETRAPMITRRPSATSTPEPTATVTETPGPSPEPYLACLEVSSQGELAGLYDNRLWVEDGAGSGEFFPVAANIECEFGWSPDGNMLLYVVNPNSEDNYESLEFWIWQKATQKSMPLNKLAPNLPQLVQGKYFFWGDFEWSPDSKKILFYRMLTRDDIWGDLFVVADLEKGKATWVEASDLSLAHGWLGSEYIYERSHCGPSCEVFTQFHYADMDPIWSFDAQTFGATDVSDDGLLIVNIGKMPEPQNVMELYHVSTGELERIGFGGVVWRGGGYKPKISPDNKLIAYPYEAGPCVNYRVINLKDEVIADFSCAIPITWMANSGLLGINERDSRTLLYYPFYGSEPQTITPEGFYFEMYEEFSRISGTSSPDGRYFLFKAHDLVAEGGVETEALFVFDAHTRKTFMVDSRQDGQGFYYYDYWMPDSQSFYYVKAGQLWRYYLATGERVEVIPSFNP